MGRVVHAVESYLNESKYNIDAGRNDHEQVVYEDSIHNPEKIVNCPSEGHGKW